MNLCFRHAIGALMLSVPVFAQQAKELSSTDRDVLLQKIQKIQKTAENSDRTRISAAVTAFQAGAASSQAAYDLYLKCVEKVQFTDEKLKGSAFRDWQKKEEERYGNNLSQFKDALRIQLAWLLLTMKAYTREGTAEQYSQEIGELAQGVFSNLEKYEDVQGVLNADPSGSVFAQAYQVEGKKLDEWPGSPMQIRQIYDKLVFPSLRERGDIVGLRAAWEHLLKALVEQVRVQGLVKEKQKADEKQRIGMKKDMEQSTQLMKYQEREYPRLLWEMEQDLYDAGDQRTAAGNMLMLVQKYVNHPDSVKWSKELEGLLTGKRKKARDLEGPSEEEAPAVSAAPVKNAPAAAPAPSPAAADPFK